MRADTFEHLVTEEDLNNISVGQAEKMKAMAVGVRTVENEDETTDFVFRVAETNRKAWDSIVGKKINLQGVKT